MSKGRTKKRYPFEPDYAVAPGATLHETIEHLGMKQKELAERTGLAEKTVSEIINGKAVITRDTALRLERVTGVPARMWNNLETNYREQLARIADREQLEKDKEWLKNVPTKELIRRGFIEAHRDKALLLDAVLQFFGVSSVKNWLQLWMKPASAFRKSSKFTAHPEAVATWLRIGEIRAREVDVTPYDKSKFQKALHQIRSLTTEPPEVFQAEMRELAAKAGVAIVFVREIPRCPVSGAARWLTPDKALIQLSLRYKSDDQLWFSFFHEAAHILHDPKKEVFIEDGSRQSEREQNADRFAANFLIPPSAAAELPSLKSKAAVKDFAQRIGVSPGIVVGRLQHDKLIPFRHMNELRQGYTWADK